MNKDYNSKNSPIMTKSYKDFKIGQKVKCINLNRTTKYSGDNMIIINENSSLDFWADKLTVGKEYIIDDVDFHFPDKIAVKRDYGPICFVLIVFFISLVEDERNDKFKKLGV